MGKGLELGGAQCELSMRTDRRGALVRLRHCRGLDAVSERPCVP